MRIGLFTDTYHPATNGIVAVVDITREHLESLGHEVFVFCPKVEGEERFKGDDHVIRFPSLPTGVFDDNRLSMFFPPLAMRTIADLELDVIHFFTPTQIGLMGVYAAQRTGAVLVSQHSTDLYEYVRHYPMVLPIMLTFCTTLPFTVKFSGKDAMTLARFYVPHRGVTRWNRHVIENSMSLVYSRCDAVIALSRKSKKQLESWQKRYHYDVSLLPTGVDALPRATKHQIAEFRAEWGVEHDDQVMLYVGRLGAEKNLAILIEAFKKVIKKCPRARLMYVGDFDYREELERLAAESGVGDRITFTGRLPRNTLGVVYAAADVFVFPSLTDTQGLVLHEAAHAGLPIVVVDPQLSEVVIDGENGFIARNTATSIAKHVTTLFDSPTKRLTFGANSKKIARRYGERTQTKKIERLYLDIIKQREAVL